MPLVIINADPNRAIISEQIPQDFQSGPHQVQPLAVFQIVIVMFERISRVVWRIDVNTLDLSGKTGFQSFQGKQIVAMDQHIVSGWLVEKISLCMMRFFGIGNQDAGFDNDFLLFPDPGQFQFICHMTAFLVFTDQ